MRHRNSIPRNKDEAQEQERGLAALALMRREKKSATKAAKINDTTLTSMQRFVGSALRKESSGRYRANPYDRIPRTLNFLTAYGPIPLTIRDSRTASKIAEYSNELRAYRGTGDPSGLRKFKSVSFRAGGVTHRFVTDPAVIDELEGAGSLTAIESLYYARMAS